VRFGMGERTFPKGCALNPVAQLNYSGMLAFEVYRIYV
jgi:hypothetical protein